MIRDKNMLVIKANVFVDPVNDVINHKIRFKFRVGNFFALNIFAG